MSTPIDRLLKRYAWARKLDSGWLTLIGLGIFLAFAAASSVPATATHPGIFQLELVGTSDNALAILRSFADAGIVPAVRIAVLADFGLIVGYVVLISALLQWLAVRSQRPDILVEYASWGIVLAGLLDCTEDIAMLVILGQSTELPGAALAWAAVIATMAALAKWTLICAVSGYTLWELSKFMRGYFRHSGHRKARPIAGAARN